jgi:hypothetical protein
VSALLGQARRWLDLSARERTPDLMRRALAYADKAIRLQDDPTSYSFRVVSEARYRNGQFVEALELLRKVEARRGVKSQSDRDLPGEIQALIAMAEARLGHRAESEAARASYRRLWADANPKASTPQPLMDEIEKTVSEAFDRASRPTR